MKLNVFRSITRRDKTKKEKRKTALLYINSKDKFASLKVHAKYL